MRKWLIYLSIIVNNYNKLIFNSFLLLVYTRLDRR